MAMKNLKQQIKELTDPVIDEELKAYQEELEFIDQKPGSVPRSEDEKEQLLEVKKNELRSQILDKDIQNRCENGWEILLMEIVKVPEEENPEIKEIRDNLSDLRNVSEIDFQEEFKKNNAVTVQECLGISDDAYYCFYMIGLNLFREAIEGKEIDPARNVFLFLTNLNPYYFEPWVGLGFCYQYLENTKKALECYERAIELNPDYYESYLSSAECYNAINEESKKTEFLEKALLHMDEETKGNLHLRIMELK